jgi:hypothetical protein
MGKERKGYVHVSHVDRRGRCSWRGGDEGRMLSLLLRRCVATHRG